MNPIICQVSITSHLQSPLIALSRSLMEQFRISKGQTIKVGFGKKNVETRVIPNKSPDGKINVSRSLAQSLSLPFSGKLLVTFQDRRLRIGPVIGILTTGFTGNDNKPFGTRSRLFSYFTSAGSALYPCMYVFTPNMIDWQRKVIQGWHYQNSSWSKKTFPFPDVIHERSPNRKAETIYSIGSTVNRLRNTAKIPIFNQGFFNKWTIHQHLSSTPKANPYIPETVLAPSLPTLQRMLDQYSMVYLKPARGSLGLGIFKVTRHPQKGYNCRFNQGKKSFVHRFPSLSKLITHFFGRGGGRFQGYLAQQGIHLIKVKDNPVDFRVHLHKDYTGKWKVVAVGSKAAGSGSVTTHMRTGGTVIPTEDLFRVTFGDDSQRIKNQLEKASITIAESLEKQLQEPLGELGLDMGIDQNRKIWMFESNSKPGRHIFLHPSLKDAGRKSARCITEYSLKLAEFI
ncbi:YheC/D like ATP-grasp [Thermoactinomyces sp. DSM 45891]|uniref:YheC/YheD family endospore coat-associated protein n=1 Tax=Thermoactinomyces sp. DSM 45891 TaxID=1761907 RepID=UPI000923063F|nr:YheC/YheD family protein [Thermoactinomyces sp. DSM 45891]SFX60063.1 YheC/D like ATP-grasp [Thermoactinomyces sp. DSM 45891]